MTDKNHNIDVYSDPDVVNYFRNLDGLQGSEEYLFKKHVQPCSEVLDIGVGGGRTTAFLANAAKSYVGIDYSPAMIASCIDKYPGLSFLTADATNLNIFGDNSFDVVIFSFNGIDYIPSDEARRRCFGEICRILKPTGVMIFSSHNARALGVWPLLKGISPPKMAWRLFRAFFLSAKLAIRRIRSRAFLDGSGYEMDPVHGGLLTHVSTPESISYNVQLAGLELMEVVGGLYPAKVNRFFTPWYYYALRKGQGSDGKS